MHLYTICVVSLPTLQVLKSLQAPAFLYAKYGRCQVKTDIICICFEAGDSVLLLILHFKTESQIFWENFMKMILNIFQCGIHRVQIV